MTQATRRMRWCVACALLTGLANLAEGQLSPADVQTITPAQPYERLTLSLAGGGPDGKDLTVQIPLRGGKLVSIPFEPALKEGIGPVIPRSQAHARGRILDTGLDFSGAAVQGLLHAESWGGAYGGRLKGGALSIKATIDLKAYYDASKTRLRSKSKLARPYIARLISFTRLIRPLAARIAGNYCRAAARCHFRENFDALMDEGCSDCASTWTSSVGLDTGARVCAARIASRRIAPAAQNGSTRQPNRSPREHRHAP